MPGTGEIASKRAIVFDLMRTLYDPTSLAVYPGVRPLLSDLATERRLFLYSRGDPGRESFLHEIGIGEYFERSYFVNQKDAASLREILANHDLEPQSTLVVGDMLCSELCAGSEIGCATVWVQLHGDVDLYGSNVPCVPTHTVHSIEELEILLKQIP